MFVYARSSHTTIADYSTYVIIIYHFYSTIAIVRIFFFLYIHILYHTFQAFFPHFSVFLRIFQNYVSKRVLSTFVYDSFAQKKSPEWLYLFWRLHLCTILFNHNFFPCVRWNNCDICLTNI